jgi:hypothetical protein
LKLENSAKQLIQNKKLFEKAVSRAQIALKNNKLNSTIGWAQIGADFALYKHPGFYNSVILESLLLEVANRLYEQREARAIDQRYTLSIPKQTKNMFSM